MNRIKTTSVTQALACRLLAGVLAMACWVHALADDVQQRLPLAEPPDLTLPSTGAGEAGGGGGLGNGLAITVPNGYPNIETVDLRLQSTAGEVLWLRIWDGQEWKFNPHWESLSQNWRNLTGSQVADTTGSLAQSISATPVGDGGCWVWVDEDWQPATGTVLVGGVPDAGDTEPRRTTPFNRSADEVGLDYPPAQRVSVDYASLCVGTGRAAVQEAEGIRRINELYLGEAGRYTFSSRTVLEKRPVQQLPAVAAAAPYDSGLGTGRMALAPQINPKGWRWTERAGDWIDYNTQGQMVAYGDRNNNTVWLVRDTQGTLRGVVDAHGRVLFTLHYAGALLTEVRDYPVVGLSRDLPPRSVSYAYDARHRLVQVTDVRGFTTRYEYDASNRIVKIVNPTGHVDQLAYIGTSVSRHVAPDGGVTDYSFEFDDTNKQFISKITGPETTAGRRVEDLTHNRVGKLVRRIVNGRVDDDIRYDTGARVELHTNARGFTTRTTRNEFEQVVETAHPDGTRVRQTYSAQHLEVTEEIDEAGTRTVYQHDRLGNLLKKTEAAGTADERVTDYVRNSLGQVTQFTVRGRIEADGSTTADASWQIDYDAQGQIHRTVDPEGHVREYLHDRAGNLVSQTDPRGYVTLYEVDAQGLLLTLTDPLGKEQRYAYDAAGRLVAQVDARGYRTQATYDAMGRRTETASPVSGVHKTQYNGQGQVVQETDEDGRVHRIEYDNFLRTVAQVDALDHAVRFGHELPDGTPASLTEPSEVVYPGLRQQIRRDQRERPTLQQLRYRNSTGEQLIESATAYDPRGLVQSETGTDGHTRRHRYDALGQRIETRDALGQVTTWAYDVRGNLLSLTDANGRTYRFEYDRNNRLVRQTLPLGQTTRWRHDAAGNIVERIDPRGNRFSYSYDGSNRLTELRQAAPDGHLLRFTTQTWDANGNLVGWSDTDAGAPPGQQVTQATLTFDEANRKTGESVTYPSPDGVPFTLAYAQAHSPAGRKTALTWPDGTQIGYGYSAHGELQSVSIPGEGIISVDRYQWVAPEALTLPGGTTQQRRYDGLMNQEGLTVRTPGQVAVLDLEDQYDVLQAPTRRDRTDRLGGVTSTATQRYAYDAENRLTAVSGDHEESFALDAVGNRTAHSRTGGSWTGAWLYDANNRLIQAGAGPCGSAGAACFEYDDAGNRIRRREGDRVTQYGYDAQNRLTQVRDGEGRLVARYGYDPQDRRLWKEQYRSRDGQALAQALRTYYLYADEGLIAEATQAIQLDDAAQTVTAAGRPAIGVQYGPRPDSEFTTGVLLVKTRDSAGQETVAYYHHDALQTPVQATDKAGRVVWAARYEAFGRVSAMLSPIQAGGPVIESNLRLPGQYEDRETGLYYNFRRYYDPDVGGYVSEDPIGQDGGVNLYLYALANPAMFVDATGECPPCAAIGVIARICARVPLVCRAILQCLRRPKDCICKKILRAGVGAGRNRPVHWVCDSYKKPKDGGPNGDSCITATMKCVVGEACSLIRAVETNLCFGGKPHKPGSNDIEKQQRRANQECWRKRKNICRKC